ncbi:uncharacterized protein PHALS_05574 [Plasmopara halstedii]|uniref:Uncharacterized protein n=1 Tax=Plasmopara halstedii TaxID=4781 RepID=A0A0P1B2N9_PLAHL|nr:uncharacterized protein PHALS_05574 [Plasmopara halstedii]CEG48100.1 hypothetical protein PHALS_05574 [Plasmopara halstedii]|eukprot:XP_024584469.1 hypothetical protein PHALS_05574 [Plasmopara halstedii]
MSGRPYARNPNAPYSGPRDLEAILPHTFRLAMPLRLRNARSEAIRRAIRRRCMQKNWRKMISMRHQRHTHDSTTENNVKDIKIEDQQQVETNTTDTTEDQEDAVTIAKRQVQELETKLKALTEQKHAKFQLLKEILIEEAKSKAT